ncbi:hypothetical protein [Fulvivirga sp.]|uniref:hypothetical protein n=1 Tax=Fulvivirga sp. TaxID=1931237 RepID=UPI0032EA90B9
MIRSLTIFMFSLVLSGSSMAQDTDVKTATVEDADFKINSIGSPELNIDLKLALPEGFQLDDESFFDLNNGYVALLKSKKYAELIDPDAVKVELAPAAGNVIRFIITGFSQKLSELIAKEDADIHITTNAAIHFSAIKGTETLSYQLKVADVEKYTSNKIILTEAMEEELIAAKGGSIFMTSNVFDFGVLPQDKSENTATEFYASFKYRSKYSFAKDKPIFFYGEGLLTTDSQDTLNYLSLYPVSYNFSKSKSEIIAQVGVEGNQTFQNYRVAANIYWQGLLENLVDLTFGEDRLRLKPVIKIGAKFYQEMENNRPVEIEDHEFSNQVFGQIYYYIPIKKQYSLILDGNAFYDFNTSVNPDEEVKFNYTVTLGIEIPKTDFKTILKIVGGENGITYQKDQLLMIGFMADLFSLN